MPRCRQQRPACTRCTAQTRRGTRCRRSTCKFSPYCHSHSPVRVGPGRWGNGLIAKRDIAHNEIIANFLACPETETENFHTWRGNAQMTMRDGANVSCCIGGMANASRAGVPPKNAQITASGLIRAKRRRGRRRGPAILQGDEVFVTYGPAFWARFDRR